MYYLDPSNLIDGRPAVVECDPDNTWEGLVEIPAELADAKNFPFLRLSFGEVSLDEQAKARHEADTFKDAQAQALTAIATRHAQMLATLSGGATVEERDTWALKLQAAQESLAANSPSQLAVVMFEAEADADGVTVFEKCAHVAQLGQAFAMLIGMAAGIKTAAEHAIKAAVDVAGVEAVLEQARNSAQAAALRYLKAIGKG